MTELICSFEEELKSNTEKIASLRLELANARSKNATSSFNVAPREVKKQQQQRKQSVLLNDPLDDEDDEEYYFEEQHHHHKQKTQKQDQYDEYEEKQEEYERSEELKRLDATRWTLQKNSRKKFEAANALRDENKNLSYSFDKLQREHDFVTEKLQAADLHVEMLEKNAQSGERIVKSSRGREISSGKSCSKRENGR